MKNKRRQAGRETPGLVPFEDAYARFAPGARAVAGRFVRAAQVSGWQLDKADAIQEAEIALAEVWKRDPTCGPGFASLLATAAQRRLINWLRRKVPVIRGVGGGDHGPPAQVYSLEGMSGDRPDSWLETALHAHRDTDADTDQEGSDDDAW